MGTYYICLKFSQGYKRPFEGGRVFRCQRVKENIKKYCI
jgi:hypothetical protein